VTIAFGETFEALVAGVQGALWARHASAVLKHYGIRSSRVTPGRAHENGVAEQAHRRLKALLAQALLVRGHAAFPDVAAYDVLVQEVVA